MPRYDEIKPYDDNNLKYLYKIVPVKDINEIQLEWYLPFWEDYHTLPTSYLAAAIGHEGPYWQVHLTIVKIILVFMYPFLWPKKVLKIIKKLFWEH